MSTHGGTAGDSAWEARARCLGREGAEEGSMGDRASESSRGAGGNWSGRALAPGLKAERNDSEERNSARWKALYGWWRRMMHGQRFPLFFLWVGVCCLF